MRSAESQWEVVWRANSALTLRIPHSTFRTKSSNGYPRSLVDSRPMDLGLAGRVALVCGSTQGLGRAVAKILAHEGARVAVNGRHADVVQRAADQLTSETGQPVTPFAADVGVPAQAEGLVERVHHELGRLDVVFCNASGPPAAPFSHQSAEAFHRAVELNLLSVVHLCRAAVPLMRKLQWGRIVCLASV